MLIHFPIQMSCIRSSPFLVKHCPRFFSSATDSKSKYTSTLLLPVTTFPLHAKAADREASVRALCTDEVYQWQSNARAKSEPFVLHDGPPYANGKLHIGHFLNKILKDVINRFQLLQGRRVEFYPGWDCHGLPIELKALQAAQDAVSADADLQAGRSAVEIRELARQFAMQAVTQQKADFRQWGVMADWDRSYLTLHPDYEAEQLGIFANMVEKGLIYRGVKPVHWSPSSQTALAEAELEYEENHTSPSIYIGFPLFDAADSLATVLQHHGLHRHDVDLLIWTTTPWTIPANMAVCYHSDVDYVCIQTGSSSRHLVVAEKLLPEISSILAGLSPEQRSDNSCNEHERVQVLARFKGSALSGSSVSHPLKHTLPSSTLFSAPRPLLDGPHVTTDSGTGLVHTAPAHGADDFNVCSDHNIRVKECLVDHKGEFREQAGPELEGKYVLGAGNQAVLELLQSSGHLVHHQEFVHRYPYDWRSKQPIIFRATEQWFCVLGSLQEKTAHCIEQEVSITPPNGKKRLQAHVAGRREWCISRQRHWGLPIPAFFDELTHEPLLTTESVSHIQKLFAQHGSSCWWTFPVEELLAEQYRNNGRTYVRGFDTMDVWFDSGVSWAAALRPRGLQTPVDLYLEGSDQHRGWFQSSLLTAVAATGAAPFKTVLTHGFVVDQDMKKMSKSVGNVINPSDFIFGKEGSDKREQKDLKRRHAEYGKARKQYEKLLSRTPKDQHPTLPPAPVAPAALSSLQQPLPALGVDVLRLWVASTDYSTDVAVGPDVMVKVAESYRKFRALVRFMLGCLDGFDPALHTVPYHELRGVDKYALHTLLNSSNRVTASYKRFNFADVYQTVNKCMSNNFSAFYCDIAKDTLYLDSVDSHARRCCQTVLLQLLQFLTKAWAPFLCHSAEEVMQHIKSPALRSALMTDSSVCESDHPGSRSVFASGWLCVDPAWQNEEIFQLYSSVELVKVEVNRLIETAVNSTHPKKDKTRRQQQKVLQPETDQASPVVSGIKRSLDTKVVLSSQDSRVVDMLLQVGVKELSEILLVSEVAVETEHAAGTDVDAPLHSSLPFRVVSPDSHLSVKVQKMPGDKCSRCWKIATTLHSLSEEPADLCQRCSDVLISNAKS